jgi:hypothetical protein
VKRAFTVFSSSRELHEREKTEISRRGDKSCSAQYGEEH